MATADAAMHQQWARASRAYIQGLTGWPEARVDSYLEARERMDAPRPGQKNCGTGYRCGDTCISRFKRCTLQGSGGSLEKLGALVARGGRPAGPAGSNEHQYRGYDLTPPANPGYAGSNPQVAKVAKTLRDRIGWQEPAATRMMIDLAEELGGSMDGLAHRLKAEKSLGRKIENEYKSEEFGGDMNKAAESMSDVVRYTMKTSNADYIGYTEKVISRFEAEGWTARVKNYWEAGQPYRGMNVALTSPDGLKVELQLHTPQSMAVKHRTHKLYEEYRVETNNKRRRQLFDRMVRITDRMIPPWGSASTNATARAPSVRRIQRTAGEQKQRLMAIGQRKVLGFQTAEEAGLV